MNLWTISLTSCEHSERVVIAGLGTATPIGRTALATAAAVRAGVSGFTQHAFMVDSAGAPVHVAQCPWLAADSKVTSRITNCLVMAIDESLGVLRNDARSPPEITLLVNLPLPRPGLPDSTAQVVRVGLERAFAGVFTRISVAQRGHAGGLIALKSAVQLLDATPGAACVVAGADSYLDPDTLEWLEDVERLHGAGERNNAWGFVPGEGAGAVLLLSLEAAQNAAIQALGRFSGVAVAHESKLIGMGAVCLGEGLTAAFRAALAEMPEDERLTDVYCDMNGEPYRADEYAFAVSRVRERFVSASDFLAPADCWGDVGAASGSLLIVLACMAGLKGYANGGQALVWASSDTGERGAAVIETITLRR